MDSYMDGYMQDELELDALALGGQPLLDDIHDEAAAHVDEHHPWDGRGDEPPERVSAYLAVLWQRVELARVEHVVSGNDSQNRAPSARPSRIRQGTDRSPIRADGIGDGEACDEQP